MRKLLLGFMSTMAAFLVFVANTGVGTNSSFVSYEPEIPECLKK